MRKVSLDDHLETSLGRRWCDPLLRVDGGGGQQRHLVSTPTLVAEPIGTPVRGSTVSRSAPHHQQVLSKARTRFLAATKTRFLSG